MFCTNCGAKVDENAKFCAVCGNKLDQSVENTNSPSPSQDDLGEKLEQVTEVSTSEPINTNENQIEKENPKTSKFSEFIDSFKSIKPGKKQEKEPEIEVPEGKSDLSKEDPIESLNQRLIYEDELHPTYFGYDMTDDRKRKDLRLRQDPNYQTYDDKLVENLNQKINNRQDTSQTFEPVGDKKIIDQDQGSNPTYADIPNEYLEARIARKLQEGRVDKNQRAENTGNVAAMIRANQPTDYYNQSVRPVESHNTNQNNPPNNQTIEQAPPSRDEPAEEKKGFKFNPLYLIPLVLLIIGLGVGYWWMNRAPETVEVDLSEYIDVTFNGDDGQATPSASINSSKLLADYGAEIAYTNKSRKDDQYSSPANQFISELENTTEFNFSKDTNISNGEEVIVSANIADSSLSDDYNVLFTNTIKSVIADGLITQEYVDPFGYINVDFEGESPNISLITSLSEDAPEFMSMVEIAPSKTSELSEGEEVNISIIYDENELENSYGLMLNPTDKTYTVPGQVEGEEEEADASEEASSPELDGGYIATVDSLDEDLLGTLKYNAGELLRNTFEQRSFTQIGNIEYLGAITGSDSNSNELKNRVMLVYEITANEDYEGKYTNDFKYYTFVEYQNVSDTKDSDGKFYTEGPMTTDNEIFHKFFVEDDYTYYEIPYYGFGFLEEVLSRVNNSLSGLTIDDSIAVDASGYFVSTDGAAGEYQGNDTRLTLREDGTLRYKLDQRVHQGSWQETADGLSLTIEGVNVDTPIIATFENGAINVPEQGEVSGQTFNKMSVTG